MGENLDLDGRMAVRTPMQWQPGKTGGFSTADPADLCRPFPGTPYGPDQVNVVTQRHDPDSLFSFVRERIRCYRDCPELGWGRLTILDHDQPSALVHRTDWHDGTLLLGHNLGPREVTVDISLPEEAGRRCVDLFDRSTSLPIGKDGAVSMSLEPYGARWFRVIGAASAELV